MPKASTALIQITKEGPGGRPLVEIATDQKASIDDLSKLLQRNVTRNADILKKFGLKACPACVSGFDIWLRGRFEHVMQVNLGR
jgi:hypothetical protein